MQNEDQRLRLCVVTRSSRAEFKERSLLARSLCAFPSQLLPRIGLLCDNREPNEVLGLPEAYNLFLEQADDDEHLVFVHDDVWLHDWFLGARLHDAFQHYDVVGVAGSAHPDPGQPAWYLEFDEALRLIGRQSSAGLSGVVSHGDPAAPRTSNFGPTPSACELLDGLFLAVDVRRVRAAGVRFDPRFRFHGYDLDFCRTAKAAGLRLGTWPIAVTHASRGNYGSDAWREGARLYLEKWRTEAQTAHLL